MLAAWISFAAVTALAAPIGCRAEADQVCFLQGPLTSQLDQRQPSELPASQPQSLSALEVELKNAEDEMQQQLRDASELSTDRDGGPGGDEGRVAEQPLVGLYNAAVQPFVGVSNAAAVQSLGGLGGLGLPDVSPIGRTSTSNGLESAQLQLQRQLREEDLQFQQDQARHAEAARSAQLQEQELQLQQDQTRRADAARSANLVAAVSSGRQQKAAQEKLEQVQKNAAQVEGLAERIDAERTREGADAAAALEAAKSQVDGLVRELEEARAQAVGSERQLEAEQEKEQAAEVRAQEAEVEAQKEADKSAQVAAEVQKIQENMIQTDELLERWSTQGSPPTA